MRFGVQVETTGVGGFGGDPTRYAELARRAEAAHWDGVFVSDSGYPTMGHPGPQEICDPWIAIAAMANATTRIRLGTLITPLPRYRPWEVGLRSASLDLLSGGRLTITVGIGAVDAFRRLGESTDRTVRVGRTLDSLSILRGLWSGEPTTYEGEFFQVDNLVLRPRAVQRPRVWVRAWNKRDALALAAEWDGLHVQSVPIELLRSLVARLERDVDVVVEAPMRARSEPEVVASYAEAGATWWLEQILWLNYPEASRDGEEAMLARVDEGPPLGPSEEGRQGGCEGLLGHREGRVGSTVEEEAEWAARRPSGRSEGDSHGVEHGQAESGRRPP
jgi:alkanesulfonate monooxygenase SsuD/methylene tetrahydromethanopterin reductase-like flavin-dependent oxidoreductase (luciferase family)